MRMSLRVTFYAGFTTSSPGSIWTARVECDSPRRLKWAMSRLLMRFLACRWLIGHSRIAQSQWRALIRRSHRSKRKMMRKVIATPATLFFTEFCTQLIWRAETWFLRLLVTAYCSAWLKFSSHRPKLAKYCVSLRARLWKLLRISCWRQSTQSAFWHFLSSSFRDDLRWHVAHVNNGNFPWMHGNYLCHTPSLCHTGATPGGDA